MPLLVHLRILRSTTQISKGSVSHFSIESHNPLIDQCPVHSSNSGRRFEVIYRNRLSLLPVLFTTRSSFFGEHQRVLWMLRIDIRSYMSAIRSRRAGSGYWLFVWINGERHTISVFG